MRLDAFYKTLSKHQPPNNINVDQLHREQPRPLQQAHNTMFETKLSGNNLEINRFHCSTTAERSYQEYFIYPFQLSGSFLLSYKLLYGINAIQTPAVVNILTRKEDSNISKGKTQ